MVILAFILLFLVLGVLFYASAWIDSGVYIKTLCRNPKSGKVVALTFDDGPNKTYTPKVLNVLKHNKVKACFFLIGKELEGNEMIVRDMVNEGHLIGNHSYCHTSKFPLFDAQKIEADLQQAESLLEKITQQKVMLFRPPFGVTNPNIAKAVRKKNLLTIGWSIRSFDTVSEKFALWMIRLKLKPGAVILLHDRLPYCDRLLERIIRLLHEKGYNIQRIDTLFDLKLES